VPNRAPAVDAGGPYAVNEGGSVTLTASATDPEGDAITYEWDLDGDGTFETAGRTVTFSAATIDGPATRTVTVRASDATGATTDQALVNVANVAPTATFSAPSSTPAGFPFQLRLTDPVDPSPADAAGLQYAFDCGSGYGPFTTTPQRSCTPTSTGPLAVGGQIRDDDGGVTEYRATVNVVVTFDSLCDLTTAYSSEPATARALCAILDAAERASNPLVRQLLLATYRVLVTLETGNRSFHAFTPEEGATLVRLSRSL
jgi:PKD domain